MQNLPDPKPYAGGTASASKVEGGTEQVGDANTAGRTKGASIPLTGGGRDDSSQGRPYANETRTCATNESEKGC